jgi:hypothetical protein
MTTQYTSGRSATGTLLVFLLALLLGAAGLALFLRHAETGLPGRLATLIAGRSTSFNTSVPAVVERIQSLNRLETVVYSLDSVVEGDKSSPVFPDILAGDKILLVVHGQSTAGIDLAKLKPEDVRIDGARRSTIRAPASMRGRRVCSCRRTRISSPIPARRRRSSCRRRRCRTGFWMRPARMLAPQSPRYCSALDSSMWR